MRKRNDILFVTGTDTGVGKTLFTALLLHHLRSSGCRALAVKPFCSGDDSDPVLLNALQDGELTRAEVNPFYFHEPVAPMVAARMHGRDISLDEVVRGIEAVRQRCDFLLVEGAGGVLAPLGENYNAVDLIGRLGCPAAVVASNHLGVINHTLLTASALRAAGMDRFQVVLMGTQFGDPSVATNETVIREILSSVKVFSIPFLGENPANTGYVKKNAQKTKKTIAQFLKADTFVLVLSQDRKKGRRKRRRK